MLARRAWAPTAQDGREASRPYGSVDMQAMAVKIFVAADEDPLQADYAQIDAELWGTLVRG